MGVFKIVKKQFETYLIEQPCTTITSIGLCEAIGGRIDVGLSQEVSRQRIVAPKI